MLFTRLFWAAQAAFSIARFLILVFSWCIFCFSNGYTSDTWWSCHKSRKSSVAWFCENSRCNSWGPWTCSKIAASSRSTLLSIFVLSLLACFQLCFPLNIYRRFTFKSNGLFLSCWSFACKSLAFRCSRFWLCWGRLRRFFLKPPTLFIYFRKGIDFTDGSFYFLVFSWLFFLI